MHARLPFCRAAPIPGWRWQTSIGSWPRVPRSARRLRALADDYRTTEILLQVFSTSQYFSEVLIRDPVLLDWLRRGPSARTELR